MTTSEKVALSEGPGRGLGVDKEGRGEPHTGLRHRHTRGPGPTISRTSRKNVWELGEAIDCRERRPADIEDIVYDVDDDEDEETTRTSADGCRCGRRGRGRGASCSYSRSPARPARTSITIDEDVLSLGAK